MRPSNKLPEKFYKFFWDINCGKLDINKKNYFVIQRLLDKGDLEAAKWIRKTYPKEDIIYALKHLRGYSLKNASFWSLIYKIPLKEVKCFQEPYLSHHRMLWPY